MYRYQVRKVSTGETRIAEFENDNASTSDFWWLDGNMGCDCNRALTFEPESDPPCGNGEYALDWVDLDGVRFIENDKAL